MSHAKIPDKPKPQLMLIHGIWMNHFELIPLGRRLSRQGFKVHYFDYHSLLKTPAENARKLHQRIKQLNLDQIHLVAHSLGGLVALHLFEQYSDIPPGKMVMLGSPIQGSELAQRIAAIPLLSTLLGRSLERGLSGKQLPGWHGNRPWAMFSGDSPIGIGTLFGGFDRPSDGTVVIEETMHSDQKLHKTLPVGHFGLLYSRSVIEEIVGFLNQDA